MRSARVNLKLLFVLPDTDPATVSSGGNIMKALKTLIYMSLGVAWLGALGCYRSEEGSPPAEQVQAQQPVQDVEQQPQSIVVQQAPPPLIVETQPPPPSADQIWVGGYWNWDNQRYVWQAGRYSAPPRPDVVWVAPRYDTGAHRYTAGQWSKSNQPQQKSQIQDQRQNQDRHPDQNNDRAKPNN
jgi:YXWGXW repeat-containing protein